MNKTTSVYLDLVRFLAAAMVLLIHANHPKFTDGWLFSLRNAGNDTVMLFFVLSGFVIAFCVDNRDKSLHSYTVSRLSRLYSVVLPALLVMVALNFLGWQLNLSFSNGTPWHYTPNAAYEFFTSLIFLNQLWFFDLPPFSNGPFWSVAYEFWFYLLFAAAFFFRGRVRQVLIAGLLLIIGPKILLLFPVWCMGYYSYQIAKRRSISPRQGLLLFGGSILLYIAFLWLQIEKTLNWYTLKVVGVDFLEISLNSSKSFVASLIVGLLASAHFIGFSALSASLEARLKQSSWLTLGIQYLASFTFTLYLLHYPLLDFWSAFAKLDPKRGTDQALLFALVAASVWLIGSVTERKKSYFKRALVKIMALFQKKLPLDLQQRSGH